MFSGLATLLDHLVVHSAGLCVVGLLVLAAGRLWRRDPVLSYRIMICALVTVLLLPPAQLLVQGRAQSVAALLEPKAPTELAPTFFAQPVKAPRPATSHERAITSTALPPLPIFARASLPEAAAPGKKLDPRLLAALFAIYLAGLLLFAVRACRVLLANRRFLRGLRPVESKEHLAIWNHLTARSRLAGRAVLLHSDTLTAPACWGILRPVVVFPTRDMERRASRSFQLALLHELTHLGRFDPLVTLLQSAMRTLFWFHPVSWWLSHRLDALRELSCDLLVVQRTGRRRSYALALLGYAAPDAVLNHTTRPALLHWEQSSTHLRRRIEMLLESKRRMSRGRRTLYLVGAGLTLSALWAGQMALAATFSSGDDEALVACRDEDEKQKTGKKGWHGELPDIARGRATNSSLASVLPIRSEQDFGSSWTPLLEPLDPEIRASLIHTLLRDDTDSVRMVAANALAPHVRDEVVKQAFLKALKHACNDVCRLTILDALLRRETLDSDVRDLLVRAITDGDGPSMVMRSDQGLTTEAEAREMLISAVCDDRNDVIQLSATEALAPHANDPIVQAALLKALRNSSNEVARMAMIESLSPFVTVNSEVQKSFLRILQRDDNEVAKMAVTRALTENVDDPSVRTLILAALGGERNDVAKSALVKAVAPFAYEPQVKSAFVEIIPRMGSEIIRLQMVEALARVITPTGPAEAPQGDRARTLRSLPAPSAGAPTFGRDLIPILKRKRS